MQFRLRTLLIVLALGPVVLAILGLSLVSPESQELDFMRQTVALALLVGTAVLMLATLNSAATH